MESDGAIPPSTVSAWRVAEDDPSPTPVNGERVLLTSHILRGFSLPPSAFLLEVLDHYGLQLHNSTPNSLLYVASFVGLFEGSLGLVPRLDFFRYFFGIKRQMVKKELLVCGCQLQHASGYGLVPIGDHSRLHERLDGHLL